MINSSAVTQRELCKTLGKMAARPVFRDPLLFVAGGLLFCVGIVASGVFDDVHTDTGYDHYAEPVVPGLPAALAMPANCLVNLAYIVLGWYWMPSDKDKGQSLFFQKVFALMAFSYGPVQWIRLWTQHHWAAVLDQWLTLPIFAWAAVWCHFLEHGWQPRTFIAMEITSLASYVLALLHPQGFELALSGHIFIVILRVLKMQKHLGSSTSACIMAAGILSCLGFVILKLWDHELAQWVLFQRFSGHFWSKICDVLQFHCAFLFFTRLQRCQLKFQ